MEPADSSPRLAALEQENERLKKLIQRHERKAAQLEHKLLLLDRLQAAHEVAANRLYQDLEQQQRAMADDLEQARAFQRALLPTPPPFGPLESAVLYVPTDQVGGDLYDVHLGPAGQLRIFLGDATGHGVQAAMRTMVAKAVYERHKLAAARPEELLERINRELCALAIQPHMWMPACCLDIALPAYPGGPMAIRYANAAHLPIYILRPVETSQEVEEFGTFLGLSSNVAFPAADLELRPGERLLAYTDGLIEQWNPSGQPLPIDELHARLARGPLQDAVAAALSWSTQFRGPTQQQPDDITLLAIEYPLPDS